MGDRSCGRGRGKKRGRGDGGGERRNSKHEMGSFTASEGFWAPNSSASTPKYHQATHGKAGGGRGNLQPSHKNICTQETK